jgi:hypothetical protein
MPASRLRWTALAAAVGAVGCGEPFEEARDDCIAMRFSGAQLIEVPDAPDFDLAAPMTIEFRVNLDHAEGEMHVLSHHEYSGSGYQLGLYDDRIDFRLYREGGRWLGQGRVTPGQWHHVAAQWDATGYWLYLDGSRVTDGTLDWWPADYAGPLRIGAASYSEAFFFQGLVDEVRISRGLRYSDDFDVTGEPVVVDADTIALWRFDDEDGQVVSDVTGQHDGVLGTSEATRPDDPVREPGHCLVPILP